MLAEKDIQELAKNILRHKIQMRSWTNQELPTKIVCPERER